MGHPAFSSKYDRRDIWIPMSTYQRPSSTHQLFSLPKRTLQEQSRLTFQHHALKAALEGNFLAPYAYPAAILDVACGSGAWTADMGKLFAKAEITGLDIAKPSCPQSSHFQFIEGCTPALLPFDAARFDFVHQRCLGTVLPTAYWPMVIHELVRVTQPGGWVELMEYGSSYINAGPKTMQFCLWQQEAQTRLGIDLRAMDNLGPLLQNAGGLEHVEQQTHSIPLSDGRAGDVMSTNLLAMIQNTKTSILALGVEHVAFEQMVGALLREWKQYKTSYQFHTAY